MYSRREYCSGNFQREYCSLLSRSVALVLYSQDSENVGGHVPSELAGNVTLRVPRRHRAGPTRQGPDATSLPQSVRFEPNRDPCHAPDPAKSQTEMRIRSSKGDQTGARNDSGAQSHVWQRRSGQPGFISANTHGPWGPARLVSASMASPRALDDPIRAV